MTPPTTTDAHVVEGSEGLLLEIDGQIVPNYDATMVLFEEGDVVTGAVVRIDKDEVLVDIGYKSEGVIPSNELSIRKSVNPNEEVEIGEEVDALVLTKEDQDGRLILSKKRARFERAWRRIEAAAESGEPVFGSVIEVVKGGLIVDLGVRGFLPASLVDIRRVPNLDEYLGQTIESKVIELNRPRNNVVLSRRAVLEEERKEQRQAILERLQPGLIIEGQISNIVEFGAFVDLDGIDGLIHISELSWSHVNHPSEILNIGDTVQVKVLDIDRDRQRISLGLKQTQEDPWQRVVDTYSIGDELEGKVTKVVAFGAFVEILEGVEGLVHISELAQQHVENPREIVQPGDDVKVKILEIDSERRRLSLSIKRVEDQILPRREVQAHEGEAADAGDLDNMPELGLSEDVFTTQPPAGAEAEAEAEVEADVVKTEPEPPAAEAPAERPRPEAAPRRPSRDGRRRPTRRAEAASRRARGRRAPSPRPTSTTPEAERPRPRSRRSGTAVRRPHGRDRSRQVRGAGGARPAGRRHAVDRRGRARALRRARGARRRRRALGARRGAGRDRRPRRRRAPRVRRARGARLARGPAVAARRRPRGRMARDRVGPHAAAAGARGRDAAALRSRSARALRRYACSGRGRSDSRDARLGTRSCPPRRADRPPAHPGREGGARRSRSPQRPGYRGAGAGTRRRS